MHMACTSNSQNFDKETKLGLSIFYFSEANTPYLTINETFRDQPAIIE